MNQNEFFSKSTIFAKMVKGLLLLVGWIIYNCSSASASTGTAVVNSIWANASTWSFDGTHRLPTCGDTLVIPSTKTVTVDNQNDYLPCGQAMIIYVYGVFQFTNGNKLDLPCGSVVFIMSGGVVKKSTAGGGTSTLISICGTTEWKAGDGPLNGIDTLGQVVVLPIDLISFEAKQHKNSIHLDWITASEINNSFFTIEKSINGREFFEIAKVKGAGNSTFSLSYTYVDHSPSEGVSYYRLKQTDYDGQNETFSPIAVKFSKRNVFDLEIEVMKNPFSDILSINVNSDIRGDLDLKLFKLDGTLIYHSREKLLEDNQISANGFSELKQGVYFLQVSMENENSQMVRVVKMN